MPVIIRLLVPEPLTPVPVALRRPLASLRLTVKVSPLPAWPISDSLIPAMPAAWPTPMTLGPGMPITGPSVVTAMLPGAAESPRLSLAFRMMASLAGAFSCTARVARSAFTCASEPLMVSALVPEPLTPVPLAVSRPEASDRVTVKVSPEVLPLSDRLTPEMAVALPSGAAAMAGLAITGAPLVVTAMLAGAAALPRLSETAIWMLSEPAVGVWSVSVARSAFTWAREPVIVRVVVPEPETPVPVAESRPLASLRVAVKVSPADVLPDSEMLTPAMALV